MAKDVKELKDKIGEFIDKYVGIKSVIDSTEKLISELERRKVMLTTEIEVLESSHRKTVSEQEKQKSDFHEKRRSELESISEKKKEAEKLLESAKDKDTLAEKLLNEAKRKESIANNLMEEAKKAKDLHERKLENAKAFITANL